MYLHPIHSKFKWESKLTIYPARWRLNAVTCVTCMFFLTPEEYLPGRSILRRLRHCRRRLKNHQTLPPQTVYDQRTCLLQAQNLIILFVLVYVVVFVFAP